MKNLLPLFLPFLAVILVSCLKQIPDGTTTVDPSNKTMKDLIIPSSFDFKTTKEVSLSILVRNPYITLSGVPVSVYLDYPGAREARNSNARLYGTFVSQADGIIGTKIKLPVLQDSLYLVTNYIGLESESGFAIKGTSANYTYGTGNTIKSSYVPDSPSSQMKGAISFDYISGYNSQGVPDNLVPANDAILKGILETLNATVPECKDLTLSNPDYFTGKSAGNLIFNKDADLWITFVSEGAKKQNSVGYYTYDPLNPPKAISDISKLNIIFPNVSMVGSGGDLSSGNKVHLGKFYAGQAIGWFLVSNGWNGTQVNGSTLFFSDPVLNPETTPSVKQHTVLFNDVDKSHIYIGFEDGNRLISKTDNDFNDAIFMITANPANAIQDGNLPVANAPVDSDHDGIIDNLDEFPNDAFGVSTTYYPDKDQYTKFLVEDLWPATGDFDFNDLVVDCNYKFVSNASFSVVGMYIKYKVSNIGGSFKNGFGIQIPILPSQISSVTSKNQLGFVTEIGLEQNSDNKAVIVAFSDPSNIQGQEIELYVTFSAPQEMQFLSFAPFNPFVFVNGDRTKEIHMINNQPTTKANPAFFGTSQDKSVPSAGTYYKTENNLPWMIEVPSDFRITTEKSAITNAYLKFGAWAESGGTQFSDWYSDKPGYRDNNLLK